MSEEENMNVEEVIQPSETEVAQVVDSKPEPVVNSAEHNWKEARRIMEEQNRKIRELEQKLSSPKKQEPDYEDELESLGQDDFLTRKQAEALALRKAQELLEQQHAATAEDRARLKYRDYDEVCSDENIKELVQDEDVLRTIQQSPDPYVAAYKLIKNSYSYNEKAKKRNVEAEKMAKNLQKPVSSNAVAQRPLSNANAFAFGSEAERLALWKETVEAARRR